MSIIARDGDMHHITAAQLTQLYNVRMSECQIGYGKGDGCLRNLLPQSNGVYVIPSSAVSSSGWQE